MKRCLEKTMRDTDPNVQRYRELLKQKRRLLSQMKRHRKSLAKARIDKKRVNEEITRLRKSGFAFAGMTTLEAQARVSTEIQAVEPGDIYPKDLEKKFDKLERTTEVKYRKDSVDISDVNKKVNPSGHRHHDKDDEGGYSVILDEDCGVVDLSEQDGDDSLEEGPENGIEADDVE